jgi:hypothetical protein
MRIKKHSPGNPELRLTAKGSKSHDGGDAGLPPMSLAQPPALVDGAQHIEHVADALRVGIIMARLAFFAKLVTLSPLQWPFVILVNLHVFNIICVRHCQELGWSFFLAARGQSGLNSATIIQSINWQGC